MKFIHLADVHLGARPDISKPWGEKRGREIWGTFENVLEDAGKKEADLLLIAGDLFHGQPLLRELKEVNYLFSKLHKTKIVLIAGNHDYMKENSFYHTFEWCENVFFLGDGQVDRVVFEDLNTDVYGLSYYSKMIQERLYDDIIIDNPNRINILLGHGGDEEHIPFHIGSLKSLGFDYLAFGHIHKPQLDLSLPFAFAGSLEPLDAGEIGEHGYVYGELTKENFRLSFVPKAKRQYFNEVITDDGSKTNTQMKDEITELIKRKGKEHIYRFVIEGVRSSETVYDTDYLRCLGNIMAVEDKTRPDLDFKKIENENKDNLLGKYINELNDKEDKIAQKALFYGTKALLDAIKNK